MHRKIFCVSCFINRGLNHLAYDNIPASGQTQRAVASILAFAFGNLCRASQLGFGAPLVGTEACHFIDADGSRVVVIVNGLSVQVRFAHFLNLGLKKFRVLLGRKAPVLLPVWLEVNET